MAPGKEIADSDKALRILSGGVDQDEVSDFDEEAYLRANPDVARAIASGEIKSALDHYLIHGRNEGRQRSVQVSPAEAREANFPCSIDTIALSDRGSIFLDGWIDDRADGLQDARLDFTSGTVDIAAAQIVRARRRDAEAALGFAGNRHFGFFAFLPPDARRNLIGASGQCQVTLRLVSGALVQVQSTLRTMDELTLRDHVLGYFSILEFCGNKAVESFYALDAHLGDMLVRQNREISRSIAAAASCEYFGPRKRAPKGSIIVCLYGKPEFQFLQNALFSTGRGVEAFEFVYVCNSPELIETLHKTAAMSERIYGLSTTVVALPGNAGFGAANNVAARFAASERLLFVNPDVFPVNDDWALDHARILATRPPAETKLFGSRLFYADGSLMHAGLYFQADWGVSVEGLALRRRPMLRVEHYGKGAPAAAPEFLPSRPVAAVSGAFISVDRAWFEHLEGFSEDYIFGHYEDVDLCLRSLHEGATCWVHDLPFWHLESKGSVQLSHHLGASLVNRWLFTRLWYDRLSEQLLGRVAPAVKGAPVAKPPPVAKVAPFAAEAKVPKGPVQAQRAPARDRERAR